MLRRNKRDHARAASYSLGHPLFFHWIALAVVAALLVLGALQGVPALAAGGAFVLVLAGISWLWSRSSLERLSFRLVLERDRAFPGEKVGLDLELTNGKGLFLTWLEAEAELPDRLATGRLSTASAWVRERFRWGTAISGGQSLRWRDSFECKARGAYRIGPVRLRSGDPFGIFPREMVLPQYSSLLVYPRVVAVEDLGLPLRGLTGEQEARRSMYEDSSRTMGARDYRSGDPFSRVHWKATSRNASLQSRVYESTTSLSLLLVLDAHSFSLPPADDESFENAVTVAASMASEASARGLPVGLVANSKPEIVIPAGSGRSQLLLILESLARVTAQAGAALEQGLDRYRSHMLMGATVVVITAEPSPSLAAVLDSLQQHGQSVSIVAVSGGAPGRILATSLKGTAYRRER